ncbi:carotenoid biosynthesis protein [Paenibacillus sp. NFR01]|uniref:carotenoid biosynthesis protein n=1 Tax=Paenibacillus sp. NFR01 TaxID=1566279 RepID=UPI0008BE157C|nr:carotenoid biosynthesis protein [Paenibacillus sp. NFR01]SEU13289.1 putative membrane protein [Paenibacillus sp. NFR01]
MLRTVFWGWYAIGALLLIFFSVPKGLQFSNGLFLVLYAVYAGERIFKGYERHFVAVPSAVYSPRLRPVRLLVSAALIWTGGMAVEWVGVHTGHLFGSYGYSEILGPLLYGVPVTLGFAWIAVVCNAVLLCRDFGLSGWRLRLLRAVQVGSWAVLLDLVLDPVAHARGFWTWRDGGGFYGVPVSNFGGWLIAGSLLSLFLPAVRITGRAARHGTRLYQAVILMFGLIGLREGLPLCMVIAVIGTILAEGGLRYARGSQIPKL